LNEGTVRTLRAVNRRFYQERASEFSRSRERPWSGWGELFDRAFELLPERPRVLDVGCGNGRFARFLESRLGEDFDYCGVDESPLGLAEARRRLGDRRNVTLVEADFSTTLARGAFDLVALFGVLHHVPGRSNRLDLLKRLQNHLLPGGLLAFSVWRFEDLPRFQRKIVPWNEFRERTGIEFDERDLEPGDHILTWGGTPPAHRYCHAMSEEEERDIGRGLALELLSSFDAAGEPNRYFVFRYPKTA
jgi:tRNA (uracil-5-)-methyltransferase TRM9